MSIVLGDTSGLAEGIKTASSALAQALERRGAERLQRQRRGALSGALEQADLTTPEGQKGFLQRALNANIPIQDSLGVLDRAIKLQQASQKQGFQTSDPKELGNLFQSFGVPPDTAANFAKLYGNLSQGGKTAFANMFVDRFQRGEFGKMDTADLEGIEGVKKPQGIEGVEGPPSDVVEEKIQEPADPIAANYQPFAGMTPKEVVGQKRLFTKENTPIYREQTQKIRNLNESGRAIAQLTRLNESRKLPSGTGRLNVTIKEGELRLPAGANAETQLYVKTINDFTRLAKDSYGARVTNFDLQQFMKRLPTLANSEEGRRLIQEQMAVINEINHLYHQGLVDVYDSVGVANIDSAEAERRALVKTAPQQEKLEQRFADVVQFQDVYDMKQRIEPGLILVEKDGLFKQLPEQQKNLALQKGWRIR
jgi:hypothetical protein